MTLVRISETELVNLDHVESVTFEARTVMHPDRLLLHTAVREFRAEGTVAIALWEQLQKVADRP